MNYGALIDRYLRGNVDAAEVELLGQRLKEDAALRREFCLMAGMDTDLREYALTVAAGEQPAPVENQDRLTPPPRPSKEPETRRRDQRLFPTQNTSRRRLHIALTVLLLCAGGAAMWWLNGPALIARVDGVAQVEGLERTGDWRSIRETESLRFEAGVVELTTVRGVRLVLEGPCDCQFESQQRVRLHDGRLFANVPESGVGFQVTTPDGTVVDLGTQFGIEVRRNQATEVHIFEGRVVAELPDDRADRIVKRKHNLAAGQAIVLDADKSKVAPIPLGDKFVRQATPFAEHFAYEFGPLPGRGGWFDSGLLERPIHVSPESLEYAGLASARGGSLNYEYARGSMPSPVGRRWHDRYFSVLIWPGDNLPKLSEPFKASFLSFGSFNKPLDAAVHVIVRNDRENEHEAHLELSVEADAQFVNAKSIQPQRTFFVVMRLAEDRVDLWLDPSAETFGSDEPPPADLSLGRKSSEPLETLWIGDVKSPSVTNTRYDAVRGGSTWAEVTQPTK